MERSESSASKVKCRLSKEWLSQQSDEVKAMILRYLKDPAYAHLCPCPKNNGGWGYRIECEKCAAAILQNATIQS